MAILTITDNGQVTLSSELPRHLGVGPGKRIEVRKAFMVRDGCSVNHSLSGIAGRDQARVSLI